MGSTQKLDVKTQTMVKSSMRKWATIIIVLWVMTITPVQAVQIEETISTSDEWSIEYLSYMESNINAYSLKKTNNTTTTPVVNGTGGLAPLEKTSEIEGGFSTPEIIGIIIFIIIILWGMYKIGCAVLDKNHCQDYIATAPANDLKTLETCAARVDGCVELIDNIQATNEWCVNLEDQLIEIPEDQPSQFGSNIPQEGLQYGAFPRRSPEGVYWQYISPLEKINRLYDINYRAYEEYSHIVDRDTYTPEWRLNQIVPGGSYSIAGYPISYNQAISYLQLGICFTSFGALGLCGMFLRRYIH